jgi:hypothetical protein
MESKAAAVMRNNFFKNSAKYVETPIFYIGITGEKLRFTLQK